MISLEPGTYSRVGDVYNTRYIDLDDPRYSYTDKNEFLSDDSIATSEAQAFFNVGIAHGVYVEDAMGGDGDDTIVGNVVPNRLEGGGGDDTLTGGGAADVFVFGDGWGDDVITDFNPDYDHLEFAAGTSLSTSVSGSDLIISSNGESLTLEGQASLTLVLDEHYYYA